MNAARLFCFVFLFLSKYSYSQNSGTKLFTSMPSSATGITFRNDIIENTSLFYYKYEYLYIGGGVAVGDINNDGLPDVYFSATTGFNKLYLNQGNLTFKDITEQAGVTGGLGIKTGVNMIDINNDGWLDIFVCKTGPFEPQYRKKILYINNGNGTFTDKAKEFGLDDASYTTQAYFFDYDRDGFMDLYLLNTPVDFNKSMTIDAAIVNGKIVPLEDTSRTFISDRLYKNNHGRFFTDVSKKAGILNNAFGLSASIFDFNNDGWQDVYVANDFNKPDFLYINNRNGTFTDRISGYISHMSLSSMGSDVADINNDGLEDLAVMDMAVEDPVRQKQLFVLNTNYDKFQMMVNVGLKYQYPHNVLQLNNGNGTFSDIAYHAGVAQTDWSWAPLIADFDNDGWKDMYITNGLKRDITDWDYKAFVLDSVKNEMAKGKLVNLNEWFKKIPQVKVQNYFYRNTQTLKFENTSAKWTDAPPSFSNGAAYADLDNDGDLDLVVSNVDDEAFILRNNLMETTPANYLRFKILKKEYSKEEAYGATVILKDENGNKQTAHYDPQRGFLSTVEHALHFGIGKAEIIPEVEIRFSATKAVNLKNVKANQTLTVYEPATEAAIKTAGITERIFSTPAKNNLTYSHAEPEFIDFKREPWIPYKCSSKGPYYTQSDVNGDGRNDLYIGGSENAEGKLLIQNKDGTYTEKKQPALTSDKKFEDCGVLFFDADGDKDNDLYVTSGGAGFEAGSNFYQDRLYLNDGKGNFSKAQKALPAETQNGSCVIALDYDNDGDNDLFIGGAVKPGSFPQHDNNILLENSKGIFTNVTEKIAGNFTNTGIVNTAAWTDIDKNGKNELILAGEWMPPQIYAYENGTFKQQDYTVIVNDKEFSLNILSGWWNCIKAADVNKDGKTDLLMGNRGTNSKAGAAIDEPCTIYAKDFDGNGSYDAMMGYYIFGKCYPVYSRDQLIDQMPSYRKKFIRYKDYAGKTMDEMFTPEQKNGMEIFRTNLFESGILINEGGFKLRFVPFDEKAQLSIVNDMVAEDFNKDGHTDILLCGNSNDPDVSTGNYDATTALLLAGNSTGTFKPVSHAHSGLDLKGQARKIIMEKNWVYILMNNGKTAHLRF